MHIDGTLRPIPYRQVNNMAPAGGIISSAADMARWLRMLLNDGRYDDTTLLNPNVVRELRAPQMIFRTELAPGTFPSAHLAASALGWFVQDYHDRLIVWHTGGAAGMSSTVGFVPEDGVAVVVLTNTLLNGLHTTVFWRAIDACLGLPNRDWSADALQQWRDPAAWVAMREEQLQGRRDESARSSVPLQALVGVYEDSTYGDVTLQIEGAHLVLRYGGTFEGDLEPWYADAFRISWRDPMLRTLSGSGVATFSQHRELRWRRAVLQPSHRARADARRSVRRHDIAGVHDHHRGRKAHRAPG